jgi:hypothetical protein
MPAVGRAAALRGSGAVAGPGGRCRLRRNPPDYAIRLHKAFCGASPDPRDRWRPSERNMQPSAIAMTGRPPAKISDRLGERL